MIDKLNIQAAEYAFMGGLDDKEDKPIELDDINVNINSSPKQGFA